MRQLNWLLLNQCGSVLGKYGGARSVGLEISRLPNIPASSDGHVKHSASRAPWKSTKKSSVPSSKNTCFTDWRRHPFYVYICFLREVLLVGNIKTNDLLESLNSGLFFKGLFEKYSGSKAKKTLYKFVFRRVDLAIKRTSLMLCVLWLRFNRKFFGKYKLQNKVVFANFKGCGYGDNPKYICNELIRRNKKRKNKIDLVWLVSNGKVYNTKDFPKDVRLVTYGTARAFYELFTSRVFIKNVRDYSILRKRKGQLFIQTWHGAIGIKKSGADIHCHNRTNAFYRRVYSEVSVNDLVLSNSPVYSDILKSSYFFNKDLFETISLSGHPRNDVFFGNVDKIKNKVVKRFPQLAGKKIVLYAPTYRDERDVFIGDVDFNKLTNALSYRFGGDWVVVARFHPRCFKTAKKIRLPKCVVNATWYDDALELMAISDVGITDYSSWIYDFMLTRKPCFLHASDADQYKENRGLYFELEDTAFPVSYSNERLLKNIMTFDFYHYRSKLDEFIDLKKIMDDGNASKRICDTIINFMEHKTL